MKVSVQTEPNLLLKSLFALKSYGTLCDIQLRLNDSVIWGHACVLTSCSSYFRDFLNSDSSGWENHWCPRKPLIIDLDKTMPNMEDCCLICVSKIIDFMYMRELVVLKDHFEHFNRIVNFFNVRDLSLLCKNIVSKQDTHKSSNIKLKEDNILPSNKCEFMCCNPDKNIDTSSSGGVQKHKRKIICEICSHSSCSVQNMVKHLEGTDHLVGYCPICNLNINNIADVKSHLREHANPKPFLCHICKKRNRFWEYHRLHLRVHCRNKLYHCQTCQRSFKEYRTLTEHLRTHKETHACQTCGYFTADIEILKSHQHQCAKKVTGNIVSPVDCNKKLPDLPKLSEKPFQCTVCGVRFDQKKNLTRHVNLSHISARQYNCTICVFATKRIDNLKHHMKKRHGSVFNKDKEKIWKEGKKKVENNNKQNSTEANSDAIVGVLIPVNLVAQNDQSSISAFAIKKCADREVDHKLNQNGNKNSKVHPNMAPLNPVQNSKLHLNPINSVEISPKQFNSSGTSVVKYDHITHNKEPTESCLNVVIENRQPIIGNKTVKIQTEMPLDMSSFNKHTDEKEQANIYKTSDELHNLHIVINKKSTENSSAVNSENLKENEDIWLNEATGELLKGNNFMNVQVIETGRNMTYNQHITQPSVESSINNSLETLILNEAVNGLSVFDLGDDKDDYLADPQTNLLELDGQDNLFSWDNLSNSFCSTWVLNETTGELNMVSFGVTTLKNCDELKLDENTGMLSPKDDETALFLNEGTGDLSVIYLNPQNKEWNGHESTPGEQQIQETLETISEHSSDDEDALNEEFLKASADFMADNENETFLNELTGEFNVTNMNRFQPSLEEQGPEKDSAYLNEETGEMSWNIFNQNIESNLFTNSDILNCGFDDSLNCEDFETFSSDMNDLTSQFHLERNTVDESCDILLNECTGELVKKK